MNGTKRPLQPRSTGGRIPVDESHQAHQAPRGSVNVLGDRLLGNGSGKGGGQGGITGALAVRILKTVPRYGRRYSRRFFRVPY